MKPSDLSNEIYRLYEIEKLSTREITKQLKILSKTSILYILRKHGVVMRSHAHYRKFDWQQILELYLSGFSINQIAEKLGCCSSWVYLVLVKNNVKIRGSVGSEPKNKLKLSNVKIKQLYITENLTTVSIAKMFNTSHQVILKRLKKMNIPRRQMSYYRYVKDLQTNCGIFVASSSELKIANWLEQHNIKYLYNQTLHPSIFRYDFYLPKYNLYIEYFGLVSKDFYQERMERKLGFYFQNKLKLLSIYPWDDITKLLETKLI